MGRRPDWPTRERRRTRHLVRRDRLNDITESREEDRHFVDVNQALHDRDADLRLGLMIDDNAFELATVDAALGIDVIDRPAHCLNLVKPKDRGWSATPNFNDSRGWAEPTPRDATSAAVPASMLRRVSDGMMRFMLMLPENAGVEALIWQSNTLPLAVAIRVAFGDAPSVSKLT